MCRKCAQVILSIWIVINNDATAQLDTFIIETQVTVDSDSQKLSCEFSEACVAIVKQSQNSPSILFMSRETFLCVWYQWQLIGNSLAGRFPV